MPSKASIDQTLARAKRAARDGDLATAQSMYQMVLDRYPGNRRARKGLDALGRGSLQSIVDRAQAEQAQGRVDIAEPLWARAAALAPGKPELGVMLARCRLDMGRAADALAAADAALARHPSHPQVLDARGRALRDMGRAGEAVACHEAALGHGAADVQPLTHLGILAQARGEKDLAETYYRRALALAPDEPEIHFNLSRVRRYSETDPHIAEMSALAERVDPNDVKTAALHFALFNALDSAGRGEEAFSHLVTANRMRKERYGYDPRRDAVRFAYVKGLYRDPPSLDPVEPAAVRPILVTGLPRSGTTLTERILARAEGVQACGELSVVPRAVAELIRRIHVSGIDALTPDHLQWLRSQILDGYKPYSDGSPVLVDKMPLNFRWIGFVCAAIPEARVVQLSRDAMSVAWSLYRHSFSGRGNAFAYDIADIAAYMIMYRDLSAFWSEVYPDQVFDLDYSALVTDTEAVTQAMAAKTGLDWSEAWLAHEESRGSVLTASSDQVRRPIYTGADEGWRRYADQFEPIREAFEAAGLV